jgi:DNA polymerase IIIc chi subunit
MKRDKEKREARSTLSSALWDWEPWEFMAVSHSLETSKQTKHSLYNVYYGTFHKETCPVGLDAISKIVLGKIASHVVASLRTGYNEYRVAGLQAETHWRNFWFNICQGTIFLIS